jgi:hypothetical protein
MMYRFRAFYSNPVNKNFGDLVFVNNAVLTLARRHLMCGPTMTAHGSLDPIHKKSSSESPNVCTGVSSYVPTDGETVTFELTRA